MAKLTVLLIVSLAATLLLADATRTIITVNEETENPRKGGRGGSMQQCEDQFEQQQNLFHCMQYMMQEGMRGRGRRGSRGSCPFGQCDDNPRFGGQHFEMCCNQLEDMDTMCRCEGLRMMMQRQMGRQMGQMDMEEMREMAGNLPSMCNLSPGQCQFGFGGRY